LAYENRYRKQRARIQIGNMNTSYTDETEHDDGGSRKAGWRDKGTSEEDKRKPVVVTLESEATKNMLKNEDRRNAGVLAIYHHTDKVS
jgi:hypothetical protein